MSHVDHVNLATFEYLKQIRLRFFLLNSKQYLNMSTQFFSKLSQNYIELLNDDEYYDVTIEVGKDPDVRVFRAHTIVLHYRSPYLRRVLTTNKKHNDGALTHIKLSNILPETFHIILRYSKWEIYFLLYL